MVSVHAGRIARVLASQPAAEILALGAAAAVSLVAIVVDGQFAISIPAAGAPPVRTAPLLGPLPGERGVKWLRGVLATIARFLAAARGAG